MRIAVLGAGHAGRALAGYLSYMGSDVSLYNRTLENVAALRRLGGINLQGVVEGFAPLSTISDNMLDIVPDRDILIVTVPAYAHRFYAQNLSQVVEDGQTILIMPGATGGAIEFSRILETNGLSKDILLGEAQTFSFVSRIVDTETALISKIKNKVRVSALPAVSNRILLQKLNDLPLAFDLASNVLETSLGNVNAMLHPAPMILNAGLIESQCGDFLHYHQLISRTVGRLIERMDYERVSIAHSLDIDSATLLEWLAEVYDAKGATLYDCIRSIDAYNEVSCASSLNHRYVLEDIPTGLVPISNLGSLVGLETPTIDSIIDMANQIYECDFRLTGRTLQSLGLDGITPEELKHLVEHGERTPELLLSSEIRADTESD